MQIIRIVADTQLAYAVPITIYGARLVHTGATTCYIYNEADNSKTAASKRIALATTTTVLSDNANIPAEGIKLSVGGYVDWTAGELFLTVD